MTTCVKFIWLIVWFLFVAFLGLSMLLAFTPADAQGLPEPGRTVFTQNCYTVSQTTEGWAVAVTWGYVSNESAHFMGSGYDFQTEPGSYPEAFTIEASGPAPLPDFPVLGLARWIDYDDPALAVFNGPRETYYVTFDLSRLPVCGAELEPGPLPLPTPVILPTPAPVCPAWSIDGASGERFCLWSLPYPQGAQ